MSTDYPDIDWINKKFGYDLNPVNLKSTLSFAILWNLMNKLLSKRELNENELDAFITEKGIKKEMFRDEIQYFKNRANNIFHYDNIDEYVNKGLLLERDYRTLTKNFLNNESLKNNEEIIALFHIVRRLRNNLYHGFKETSTLQQQEENFFNANSFIKKILGYC